MILFFTLGRAGVGSESTGAGTAADLAVTGDKPLVEGLLRSRGLTFVGRWDDAG